MISMNKKIRIGIITFANSDNVGAVLQAFGLQQYLNKNNKVITEIINYSNEKVEGVQSKTKESSGKLEGLKKKFLQFYHLYKNRSFEKFRKRYLIYSKNKYNRETIKNCVQNYDIFITGSDQVFNLSCSDYDYSFFLDFVPNNKLKYSYAASGGNHIPPKKEVAKVKKLLQAFDKISVRENSCALKYGVDESKGFAVSLDPIFLLPVDTWESIMSKKLCKNKYVFVYLISFDKNVLNKANEYAKENGYKVICNKTSLEFISHGSPTDFLSWVYHAEAVFTNSFHGTAFSVLFNKKLGASLQMANGFKNNRIEELLEMLECKDCIMDNNGHMAKQTKKSKAFNLYLKESSRYLDDICNNRKK